MTEKTHLVVTLTGRPPVRIATANWPKIASASDKDYDNQYEFQANRTWDCYLNVRQHADGRTLVYGIYLYDTQFQSERNVSVRAGDFLSAGADLPAAIRAVGERMAELVEREEGSNENAKKFLRLLDECIADLPAEDLSADDPPLSVVFDRTPTGWSAYSPHVDGCVAAAETLPETARLMDEALTAHTVTE